MSASEFDLLLACCRSTITGGSNDEVRSLAKRADWPKFRRLVSRHRVERLASKGLEANGVALPSQVADELAGDAMRVTERNLRFAQESRELLADFDGAGIELLFIKGLTLSVLAYGDPFLKTGTDIDILVEPEAAEAAARLISGRGYEPVVPHFGRDWPRLVRWHQVRKESAWRRPDTGQFLDLHTALSDTPWLISGIGMRSPVERVPVTADCALPTLTTPDLFAYLCVHGAWSAWFRLKWIADVAALLHRAGPSGAEALYRHALQRKAGRTATQALLLARQLFAVELPPALIVEIEKDPLDRLLLQASLREIRQERPPGGRPLGTVALHLIRPLFLDGSRAKVSEVIRQLRDAALHATL